MKKTKAYLFGALTGFVNALFGAGGGMIAVPFLRSRGLSQKQAQAASLCVILPLSALSSVIYLKKGFVTISQALPFLPFAVGGAVFGTLILKKADNKILKKIFALFMLWAGFRMVTK